jgi:hypothetical protein
VEAVVEVVKVAGEGGTQAEVVVAEVEVTEIKTSLEVTPLRNGMRCLKKRNRRFGMHVQRNARWLRSRRMMGRRLGETGPTKMKVLARQ